MKTAAKLFLLSIITVFALSFSGCGENKSEDNHNDHGGDDHSAAMGGSEAETSDYPLTTCVVSGEALGGMGTPVEVVHDGVTVKLCCKSCIDDFNATPEVFVAKVKADG